MRSAKNRTPKATKLAGTNNGVIVGRSASKSSAEKQTSSTKKLVQARLPFKIFTADEGTTSKTEMRKRKLSYDNGSDHKGAGVTEHIKENLGEDVKTGNNSKKSKTAVEKAQETTGIVVVLDDSSSSDAEPASPATKIQPKASKLQTPKAAAKDKTNKRGVGCTSNQSVSSEKKRSPKLLQSIKAAGQEDTATPPTTTISKSKRRKCIIKLRDSLKVRAEDEQSETSDTIEEIAKTENPQKRIKFAATENESTISKAKVSLDMREKVAAKTDDGASKEEKPLNKQTNKRVVEEKPATTKVKIAADAKEQVIPEPEVAASIEMVDLDTSLGSTEETEANSEERVNTSNTDAANTTGPMQDTLKPAMETTHGSNLTPKQQKLREQWRKAREEKELKLQEEKQQKQQEKEEREQAKKRDRVEREEQKRKEREEKEEQRRKEREEKEELRRKEREEKDEQKRLKREEKERERLAEQEVKNEEKRKKEQEKEEAEQKKKRAAQAFTKFFVQKPATAATRACNAGELPQQVSNADVDVGECKLAFQPFQIKIDMKLAPIRRKLISTEAHDKLDNLFRISDEADDKDPHIVRRKLPNKAQLYLSELASGKLTPGKWLRATLETTEDDVVILEDDIERVGQAIVEEHKLPNERLRAKYFKFHENQRPPYYGTWRKKTNIVTARRPFTQDTKYLDYEVDSDLEWEEEEPGESLDGSEDEKDKESDEDDYEVDNEWFVPHGHLSEEELQNDEDDDDANTREAQKAKLKILQQEFAQEMRKATKQIKPRLIGCIWVDEFGNQPDDCPNIIWETLSKRAMLCTHTGIKLEPNEPAEPVVCDIDVKPLVLTTELQQQLVRLVHGNSHSKSFLVAEFLAHLRVHVEALKTGESLPPSKTTLREKIDECAAWKAVELVTATPLKNASKKQKRTKKRLCWVAAEEVLQRLELTELTLSNDWCYTLPPKFSKSAESTKKPEDDNESDETSEQNEARKLSKKPIKAISKNAADITKFAKVIVPATNKSVNVNASTVKSLAATTTATDAKAVDNMPAATATEVSKPNVDSADANEDTVTIKSSEYSEEPSSRTPTASATTPAITKKKRVPLLMSVGRGEEIPLAKKNALIRQFLEKDATSTATCEVAKQTVISNDVVADNGNDVIMLD